MNKFNAFTLAEVLIALVLLGVLAAFIIPKLILTQQYERYNASTKEVIAMISEAYQMLKADNQLSANTNAQALIPYLNLHGGTYTGPFDGVYNQALTGTCNVVTPCYKTPQGGLLGFWFDNFNGTTNNNVIIFTYDPDAKVDPNPTGSAKSILIGLYYNGKVTSYGNFTPGSNNNGGAIPACPSCDPPWFKW